MKKESENETLEDEEAEFVEEISVVKEAVPYVFEQGKFSVRFMVPGDYTWDEKDVPEVDEELGMVMFPRFTRANGDLVDCRLHVEPIEDLENGDAIDAEEAVQDNFGYLSDKEKKGVSICQTVVDGKYIVHYFVTKERSGFDKYQSLYAVCDIDRGKYFEVEMLCGYWKPELDVSAVESFFHITTEV